MSRNVKKNVRILYSELVFFLSQIPTPTSPNETVRATNVIPQYKSVLAKLIEIDNDYVRFVLEPEKGEEIDFISLAKIRIITSQLIGNLHSRYFPDETPPFGGTPHTIVTQLQNQQQTTSIVVDLTEKITDKLKQEKLSEKEKSFLQKLKDELRQPKSAMEIISTILKLGNTIGLSIPTIRQILNL